MCAKYYERRYLLKKGTSSKLAGLLDTASKFALFSVSGLKDERLIKQEAQLPQKNSALAAHVYLG